MTVLIMLAASASYGQYCLPTYGNPCTSGDFIESFDFNTISNLNTGCANPSPNNFTDYTSLSTTVLQGQAYTATCTPGPSWGQYFVIWIDFNQDGDFDEVNEFFDIGYGAAGTPVSNTVTIPNGVASGNTTMRVLCHFGTGVINQPDACIAQTWGEVEDYSITIGAPPAWEASMDAITAPGTGCGLGMEDVIIDFTNNGINTVDTIVVCYNVNGGAAVCDTITGLGLASGNSTSYTFTTQADMSTPNDYFFNSWLVLPFDSTQVNDTVFNHLATSVPTITGLPYFEDFNSGTGGWVPAGTNSSWDYGVPSLLAVFSDTVGPCAFNEAWATGVANSYNPNEASFLESPCIDFSSLTADPFLRFDHLFQVESSFELHWVELSTDGGATWNTLGGMGTGLNWYNLPTGWDGISYANPGEWRSAQHLLAGTAGQADVRIRFAFTSDGSVQQEGIAIDNIRIADSFDDAYAINLTNPVSLCGLTSTEMVSINVFNNGSDTIVALPVCYSINGGTPVCETLTVNVAPNTAESYDFTTLADLSVIGDYNFALWTGLAGDINTCNDTTWATVTNILTVTNYPYQEKFEGGQGGWTIDNTGNGTWDFGTPAKNTIMGAGSGMNSFVTGGLGTGAYNVNEQSFVNGPCFDFTNLPANPWVAMRVWWNSENSWDGANLQFSVDTGATWQNVGAFGAPDNWYNDNTISGAPGGSQEGWTGNAFNNGSQGWVWAKHPLDTAALAGQPYVQMRVAFGSDGSVTDDGFAFDDFAIAEPPTVSLGPDYSGCGMSVDLGLPGTYEWLVADTADSLAVNAIPVSTDQIFELTNTSATDSAYQVIVVYTDTFGLCASDTMVANILPTPNNDLGPDTVVCYGDSVWYTVNQGANYTYDWNNGSFFPLTFYQTPGSVVVTVTDSSNGCAHTDSTHIISTLPIDLGGNQEICDGDSLILTVDSDWDSLVWSTGDSTHVIVVNATNIYTVSGVDSIGCTSSDNVALTVNALPTTSITGGVDTMCVNHILPLDAGAGFAAYSWSTGGAAQSESVNGSSLTAGQTNTITVTVTDGNGCVNDATIDVYVDECVTVEELTDGMVLSYYPNPSRGLVYLTIENTGKKTLNLSVVNTEGRTVWSERYRSVNSTFNEVLDLSELAQGVYFMQVEAGGVVHSVKLVRE